MAALAKFDASNVDAYASAIDKLRVIACSGIDPHNEMIAHEIDRRDHFVAIFRTQVYQYSITMFKWCLMLN